MLYSRYMGNFSCYLTKLGTLAPRNTLCSKKIVNGAERKMFLCTDKSQCGIYEQIVDHCNKNPQLKH